MTKHLHMIVCAVALVLSIGASDVEGQAQAPPQPAPPQPVGAQKPNVPLQVQVVLSRYQGDKKISSVPYMLAVKAFAQGFPRPTLSQLKMGSSVPVMTPTTVKGKSPVDGVPDAQVNVSTFNYQNIGTQIDCTAIATDDGRFELNIAVEDSSVYVDDQLVKNAARGNDPPILRSFRASNQLILRDGQSTQFTAATDRISGESIRIEVSLTVMK